jgi:FtsH-binding integral membrane protein
MNNQPYISPYNLPSEEEQSDIQRGFITRVYGWMTAGLVITTLAALATISTPGLMLAIARNQILFFGLMIAELGLVVGLSALINRMSPALAGILFGVYAALTGVTFAFLLVIYTASSVAVTFGVTAATFGIMTLWGYTTRRDLTRFGSLLVMALIGLILASVVNIFLKNSAIYWITTYVGILIFVGLIAYDTQKLKRMSLGVSADGQVAQKAAIIGALGLYLDFINLFLMLLRILGKRRR